MTADEAQTERAKRGMTRKTQLKQEMMFASRSDHERAQETPNG